MQTIELGSKGEKIAVDYLTARGYTILNTNWHWGHKEIDIIASLNNTLVVIEVKTRENNYWEDPKDAVRLKKQRNIISAADAYVTSHDYEGDVQFDIVSIIWNNGKYSIEHIEDAFYPLP